MARKRKASRPRCEPCGKAIYTDTIEARFEASYSSQAVVRCPQNKGYHLTSLTPQIQEHHA
jgi:hypothetical protein